MPTPFRITIDGKEYPCTKWGEVEKGKSIERVYKDGYPDGIGESHVKSDKRCLFAHWIDLTSPPYQRLYPSVTQIAVTLSVADQPLYAIRTQSTDGTPIPLLYLFQTNLARKIRLDTNVVIYETTNANTIYGRPALYDGAWRIPRGDKISSTDATNYAEAATLTPGLVGAAYATEFASIEAGIKARHFATIVDEGVSKLARAFSNSLGVATGEAAHRIALASSATGFATTDVGFEVGDSSLPISDLLVSQGELEVIKPDGPYRFSPDGTSLPQQALVQTQLELNAYRGSNSHAHGPYTYWIDPSGLWRIYNDTMTPVDYGSDLAYCSFGQTDLPAFSWNSVVAFGRWLYATNSSQLWQGYIEDDGKVKWFGPIIHRPEAGSSSNITRVVMIPGGTDDTGPILFYLELVKLYRINLMGDGSTRQALNVNRGIATAANIVPRLMQGTDDFDMPDRLKQARRFWILVEKLSEASGTMQGRAIMDGGAEASIGASPNITANGLTEKIWTPGTADTFREAQFGYQHSVVSGTSDPRVRAWGVEVRTPSIYQAEIPLTPESVVGFSGGIRGMLKRLRDLQNAQLVAIKEPEINSTFNGYVMKVIEEATPAEGGEGVGYNVKVLVQRFTIPA